MRNAADIRVLGRFLSRYRKVKKDKKDSQKCFPKAKCHFEGLDEMTWLFVSCTGEYTRLGKSVDECVVSFGGAFIGHDIALPLSHGRRSCGIVQILDDCTALNKILKRRCFHGEWLCGAC